MFRVFQQPARARKRENDPNKRAKHREVARRYAWDARMRNGPPPSKAQMMALCRLRDLESVFFAYYGATLPEEDAGRDNLFIMANHIANLGGEVGDHITSWAQMYAPGRRRGS